jgi:hypothetical protein
MTARAVRPENLDADDSRMLALARLPQQLRGEEGDLLRLQRRQCGWQGIGIALPPNKCAASVLLVKTLAIFLERVPTADARLNLTNVRMPPRQYGFR